MIKTFADRGTEDIYNGRATRRARRTCPRSIWRVAQRKLDQLSAALASVQGMMLGITVTDQVYGKVKVDFEQGVPLTADQAKPLLLETLSNHGAMIDESLYCTV